MPITLESRIRRMQVVNLPHEVFCRERCGCAEMTVVVVAENPRTGDRAPKRVTKLVPASMTWLALERRDGLPRAILDVPEVKAALAHRHLRLVEDVPDHVASASTGPGSHSPSPAPSAPAPKGA
jgi:hypothetical protein